MVQVQAYTYIRPRASSPRGSVPNVLYCPWIPGIPGFGLFLGASRPTDRRTVVSLPLYIFFVDFWHRLGVPFCWILVTKWCQLASQNAPKIHPKSIQEPSKIHPNIYLIFDHFFNRFLMKFYWFFDAPERFESVIFCKQSTRKRVFWDFVCLLLGCPSEPILASFWEVFGRVLGGKLDLKS